MNEESVKEFFGKARNICVKNIGQCWKCPLSSWCVDGIFGENKQEIEDLINCVKEES